MEVQFAVSTWLWTSPFTTEHIDLFPKIKNMGFNGVEIAVEDPDLLDLKTIKTALIDHQLIPIICGAFGPSRDLTHADPAIHQVCFDYIERCFDICNYLDTNFLAGPIYSAVGKARRLSDKDRNIEFDLAVYNLQKVCHHAQRRGLSIAIEPLNRFETDLINTCSDVVKLIQCIDSPSAKILLDSFHMTLEERDLAEAVKTAGNQLIHMQVSENHRGIPGTGQTHWDRLKAGLTAIDYQGFISIESFTPHVQELADAVCIWKPFTDSQDTFATQGLSFLKEWIKTP
jgi:D-psicose/D-tagatose/L-ribulose 3-epimerase|tara:strand:+ start:90 stop:947 length:858 start_codon:yes stop_codon:yes gene_type:complete